RAALQEWLDYHRQTLVHKCAGLTAEQLCLRAVPPSTLSLLGLVRHMLEVERSWFLHGLARLDRPPIYYSPDNRDGDFDDVDPQQAEADYTAYLAECAEADAAIAGKSLDDTLVTRRGETIDLRWIYLHMIEEYARHNGHADLLRECIDGVTGD
ncbi:MAG: DinB family protein, partial [Jatrophihabitans sp.]|uniref:DinB family protein n=1 Tax=Jatrophihabitans sp. TaxID=1932789 RepID=UPI003F7D30EB